MMNVLKKSKGVITVFVSLMLVSVLSLGTLVIEAGRFQAAKNQMTDATISSCTSMIAAYNPELFDRYGLLAIDTERFTEERARDYLDYNADLSPSFFGNKVTRLYSIDSIELQGMYNLTYPAILKQQLLSRAKYHVVPQDYALNYYNLDSFFEDYQNKCNYVETVLTSVSGSASGGSKEDIEPEMLEALNALNEAFGSLNRYDALCDSMLTPGTVALLPSSTGTVESTAPAEDADAIKGELDNAISVLGSSASDLVSEGTRFSQTDVNFRLYSVIGMTSGISDFAKIDDAYYWVCSFADNCISIAQGINASIDMLLSDKEGNLLLNSYIAEYFSNRNNIADGYAGPGKGSSFSEENANFVAACVEYIFCGNASETINQKSAYEYIFAMRFVNNLYSVLTSSYSFQPENAYSALCNISWAYFETCCDMELLTNYDYDVPMNKYSMILDVNSPNFVKDAFSGKSLAEAMDNIGGSSVSGIDSFSYKDSLSLALWLIPNSKKMQRVADLIQLEMRYREQYVELKGASFLMSEQNTYCRIKCRAKLNSILPILSLGSNGGINGISLTSIKYAGY